MPAEPTGSAARRRGFQAAVAWLPLALGLLGLLWAALSLLDPPRSHGILGGSLLAAASIGVARLLGRPTRALAVLASLTFAYAAAAYAAPDLRRGDSLGYFAWLRSAAFDRDLDFANEYEHWNLRAQPTTATGRRYNQYTAGPAL
ncbi:MAG TPA: hypothetical protein VIG50_15185, partial [Vicinamibacteria bacterium]